MAKALTDLRLVKGLTFMMFLVFAMTTDSVGVIIPEIIKTFQLSLAAGGAFHYATMAGISLAGIGLGYLADKMGRKWTIILGLGLFSLSTVTFAVGESFSLFVGLLFVSGLAIGIFKTGALALIGDVSRSTTEHTSMMNIAEGFFGLGAILGPAIVGHLLASGMSWKWLYVIASMICLLLIALAAYAQYPAGRAVPRGAAMGMRRTFDILMNRYALGFSTGISLYVAVEVGIYVWMPTYLAPYHGPAVLIAAYAISIFFILRALGRFIGAWMLAQYDWKIVLTVFSLAILLCFFGSVVFGIDGAVYLMPASGLFMSVMYPTINSKGISCFRKAEHGAVSGVILFFTCASAIAAPLAMAVVSDYFHDPKYGFVLSTGLALLLFLGSLLNVIYDPCRDLIARRDLSEYPELYGEDSSAREQIKMIARLSI